MTTMRRDPLVDDYLRRLEAALIVLRELHRPRHRLPDRRAAGPGFERVGRPGQFLALLIPPVVVLGGAVVVMIGSASVANGDTFDSGLGPVEIAVLLANVFSGLAAASYLSARLRRTAVG
jgi:hypothetical protein